jgi:hypothetical protein
MPYHPTPTVRLSSVLLALGLAAPGWSAIAGVPEEPRPGTLPGSWLTWSNDSFGGEMGRNTDDYRTNAFSGGLRVGDHWVVAFDYSMMTYLQVPGSEERCDELTATLGYRLAPDQLPDSWLIAGAGIRHAGDLNGDAVQNGWHDLWGYDQVDVPYEDGGTEGVAYLSAGWAWRPNLAWSAMLDHHLGLHLAGTALATTGGEYQMAVEAKLAATGRDAAFWIGLRQQFNAGTTITQVAEQVAEHEEGTWLIFGTSAGAWSFDGGTDLRTQATIGRIGFLWQRGQHKGPAQVAEIEGILGFYEGYALGLQYRWRPQWLADLSGGRAATMLDYRFGKYPGMDWYGNNVVVRQPLVGIDVGWSAPRAGFQLTPFAYVAAGVREESVEVTLPGARYPTDRAVRAVVQGGVGLRCAWGPLPTGERTARYGVSVVYDVWQPFGEAEVSNGIETGTYQQRNSAAGVRLAATVAW